MKNILSCSEYPKKLVGTSLKGLRVSWVDNKEVEKIARIKWDRKSEEGL